MSNKFVYQKQRIKKKISFVRTVYKCFSNALILTNLRDVCLEIKDKQVVKISLKKSNEQFGNYKKQSSISFVIFDNFISNLEEVQKPNRDKAGLSYLDKYQ